METPSPEDSERIYFETVCASQGLQVKNFGSTFALESAQCTIIGMTKVNYVRVQCNGETHYVLPSIVAGCLSQLCQCSTCGKKMQKGPSMGWGRYKDALNKNDEMLQLDSGMYCIFDARSLATK